MNIKPLTIGNISARLPIIQGGMGIGVSLSNLAGAVAKAGGVGIISGAQPGYLEEDFKKNPLEANLRALKKHIKLAKEKSQNGIIGVNLMVAMNNYAEHVKAAIDSGVDLIISGAGLPSHLPKFTKGSDVKIAPIVSSLKAAKVILKLWDRHHKVAPDMIVIEGPKAGGHLGFTKDSLEEETKNFDSTILDIIKEKSSYEDKYEKKIPVVVAGGIFDGNDIAKYLKLGANGVQMATRFVATEECDANIKFKEAYINCNENNISIVKSPVGMPGRAIRNSFVENTEKEKSKITHCYNCLIPCNPADTPYCISQALINAVKGDLENGLIFCGENASKVDKIVSVETLMNELENELLEA
ncbi:nitronate monooxygenase family protein [Clostridium sp. LIBA-8841]|uniref:NAD(P)H-dependent flavin oxidoreductase n=1 Tax=Clostridium sp. LIBA-8841 TaxID=2987530 RepID=UPI002AC4080A|nr:nitronate monooxygenase family protein [Clostridium sp. LIBA-8841]MDZ5253398.1 nitronate monooxygenase family protein [Clostridium sp. LIBA-8841]